jgi:hypothetical protein
MDTDRSRINRQSVRSAFNPDERAIHDVCPDIDLDLDPDKEACGARSRECFRGYEGSICLGLLDIIR